MRSFVLVGLLVSCVDLTSQGIYQAKCTACHNSNPALDGSVGPAIKGSSLELLREKVLRAEYPIGYTPKRGTRIMPKIAVSEAEIRELAEYLK